MSALHNARISEPSAAAIEARTALAELAIPCADVASWADASPEYQSTPSDHPLRRLIRAYERIAAKFRGGSALPIDPTAIDRILATATPDERARAALAIAAARRGVL